MDQHKGVIKKENVFNHKQYRHKTESDYKTPVTILIGGAEQTVSDCNHDIIDETSQKPKIEAYGCEQEMSGEIIQAITKQ